MEWSKSWVSDVLGECVQLTWALPYQGLSTPGSEAWTKPKCWENVHNLKCFLFSDTHSLLTASLQRPLPWDWLQTSLSRYIPQTLASCSAICNDAASPRCCGFPIRVQSSRILGFLYLFVFSLFLQPQSGLFLDRTTQQTIM